MRREKNRKSRGFTLVELMIVVAIIGTLAAISIPKFSYLVRKSNDAGTKASLGALRTAVALYNANTDGYNPSGTIGNTGELAASLVPTYVKAMPVCKTSLGGIIDHGKGTEDVSLSSADESNNPGRWGYNPNTGDVFVNCTHGDYKARPWDEY